MEADAERSLIEVDSRISSPGLPRRRQYGHSIDILCISSKKQTGKHKLTDREREILGLIATGKRNKLIAQELTITEGAVKVHVKHILKKLNPNSRVEAAMWAVKAGFRP